MTTIEKCFLITGRFEGGGYAELSGNFDDQGISFGFIQWNLGQGTLQPVLKEMAAVDREAFRRCFTQPVAQMGGQVVDLSGQLLAECDLPPSDAVQWAAARQDARHVPLKHWADGFHALAAVPAFDAIQRKHAMGYMATAQAIAHALGFLTERGLALCFDIAVQCGSITPNSMARYHQAIAGQTLTERQKLSRLASAVAPQGGEWQADVLARKACIADGHGAVHGDTYNLDAAPFDLGDGPITAG